MIFFCDRHEHNYIRSIALKDFRSDHQMDQMLRHVGNHCSRLKEVELLNCCVRSDTLIRLGMLSFRPIHKLITALPLWPPKVEITKLQMPVACFMVAFSPIHFVRCEALSAMFMKESRFYSARDDMSEY